MGVLKTLVSASAGIENMTFSDLDKFVEDGATAIQNVGKTSRSELKEALAAMIPAIRKIHDALSSPGKRTDLAGTPDDLTFGAWIKNKQGLASRATIYRLLAAADPTWKQAPVLPVGSQVIDVGTKEVGTITYLHETDGEQKVDVKFGNEPATTLLRTDVKKVPVIRITYGDLVLIQGAEYKYVGTPESPLLFERTATPTLAEQSAAAARAAVEEEAEKKRIAERKADEKKQSDALAEQRKAEKAEAKAKADEAKAAKKAEEAKAKADARAVIKAQKDAAKIAAKASREAALNAATPEPVDAMEISA